MTEATKNRRPEHMKMVSAKEAEELRFWLRWLAKNETEKLDQPLIGFVAALDLIKDENVKQLLRCIIDAFSAVQDDLKSDLQFAFDEFERILK